MRSLRIYTWRAASNSCTYLFLGISRLGESVSDDRGKTSDRDWWRWGYVGVS